MRVYYLFKVNNYFYYMYKNKPFKMYKMLEEIYHTKNTDLVLTYRMFEQIASPFNKNEVNNYIDNYLKDKVYYMKSNNIHLISNNIEYSKLSISKVVTTGAGTGTRIVIVSFTVASVWFSSPE